MKIAFLLGEFPSISETFILNQITGLIDRGHIVDIYATKPIKAIKYHDEIIKYKLLDRTYYAPRVPNNYFIRFLKFILLFSKNLFLDPKLVARSLSIFRFDNPRLSKSLRLFYASIPFLKNKTYYDIIHCHHGTNGLIGILLKDIQAIHGSLIITFHGYDINVIPKMLGNNVYDQLFEKANLITANSRFTKNKLIQYGCPEHKIKIIPVGINACEYSYAPRILNINQPINIITVARLVEKKGIEYSIKAISKVLNLYPNIYYQIIGDGPLYRSLSNLIEELGASKNISILGAKNKEEVLDLYKSSHIFMLSSVTASDGDMEGQGMVLQEAQCMGLPVIATTHNGFEDSILNEVSGFLVPEKDIEALADKLIFLIENPQLWASIGFSGHVFVKNNFDIDTLNNRLINIYTSMHE